MSSLLQDLLSEYVGMSGDKFFCPFCNNKKASLLVDNNLYSCQSCSAKGDHIDALMKLKGLSRDEALESIGQLPDVKPIVEKPTSDTCLDFFKFRSITEEMLDLYGIYIRDDVIYYPCSDGKIVSHKVISGGNQHWIHNDVCNVFGLEQVALDCTKIYVTESILEVFYLREEGKNAVALLDFDYVTDGIDLLPPYVDTYVFCVNRDKCVLILEYFFNHVGFTQKFTFLINCGGDKRELDYSSFIEYDISCEKDDIICLKKIDTYKTIIRYSSVEVKQKVTDVLNYTIEVINNRIFPIENTEAALLEIILNDAAYINEVMLCYDFFHKDTQKIINYVKRMLTDPQLTPSVVKQSLLSNNDNNMRNRYKNLSELKVDTDVSLFRKLLVNLVFYGCKRATQQLIYDTTNEVGESLEKMSDFFISTGLRIGSIKGGINSSSFDAEKCVKSDPISYYEDDLSSSCSILTGIPLVDDNIHFATRTVTTIIGHSGEGKSVFLVNVLIKLLKNNPDICILWIDLEMTPKDMQSRIYGACSGNSGEPPLGWQKDYPDLERVTLLIGSEPWGDRLVVSTQDIINYIQLMATIHRKQEKKLSMIVIDHVHQIGSDRNQDVASIIHAISMELPSISRIENLSIVLVAQLNKPTGQIYHWEALLPTIDDINYGSPLKRVTSSCVSVCDLKKRRAAMSHSGSLRKTFENGVESMYTKDKMHISISKLRAGESDTIIEFKWSKAAYFIDLENGDVIR